MKNFNLTALTDEQGQEFVALLNRELFESHGWIGKNARFTNLKQNDDSSVYLGLKVNGWRESEFTFHREQIQVDMTLLLNGFSCLEIYTDPVLDLRYSFLGKDISKLWRKFLLSQFRDEYEPMLSQYRETKRQELLENQQKEMQDFEEEYCYQP